ncbi:hypothetical protein ABID37_003395 [Aquamicrobium terrae]|uniref:Transposase IS801/IS1294 domain-containing protein n=1 Tax=Aquamicrobium terrae TaxID=1324945 RepID=A0ABV2N2A5_9HYPH
MRASIEVADIFRFAGPAYRREGTARHRTLTLEAGEFIRRFLLHTLPRGFHRIRHYGFLTGPNRKAGLEHIRELLGAPPISHPGAAEPEAPTAALLAQPEVFAMIRHGTIKPPARDDVLRARSIRVPNTGVGFVYHTRRCLWASSSPASELQPPYRGTRSAEIASGRLVIRHGRQPQTP